jgi:hypothetical protein
MNLLRRNGAIGKGGPRASCTLTGPGQARFNGGVHARRINHAGAAFKWET